jgi:hypothetical protein
VSELLRTTAPPDFARLATRELARLCHRAEDTGDDVLLCEVHDEVTRRQAARPGTLGVFMTHYWDLWRTEFRPRR